MYRGMSCDCLGPRSLLVFYALNFNLAQSLWGGEWMKIHIPSSPIQRCNKSLWPKGSTEAKKALLQVAAKAMTTSQCVIWALLSDAWGIGMAQLLAASVNATQSLSIVPYHCQVCINNWDGHVSPELESFIIGYDTYIAVSARNGIIFIFLLYQ